MLVSSSRIRLAAVVLAAASTSWGCAYRSTYRPKSEALQPPAIDAQQVQVVDEGAAAPSRAIELGIYRGRAPTRAEVVAAARRRCGEVGGRYLLVRSQGPRGTGTWELEGVCAWSSS